MTTDADATTVTEDPPHSSQYASLAYWRHIVPLPLNPVEATTYLFWSIGLALRYAWLWRRQTEWRDSLLAFAVSAAAPLAVFGSIVHRGGFYSRENVVHHLLPLLSATAVYRTLYGKHANKWFALRLILTVLSIYLVQLWRHRAQTPTDTIYKANPFASFRRLVAAHLASTIGVLYLLPSA